MMIRKMMCESDAIRIKIVLWAVVFILLPSTGMGQDNKETLIQELYVKSGMEKQIGQLPGLIRTSFDQAAASDEHLKIIARRIIKEFKASIDMAFAPESIKESIIVECRENLGVDELIKVLYWLDSPLGRKLTKLEEAASTPEKYTELQQYALQLQESPPSPERIEIMQKLDTAVKATESNIEIFLKSQIAVAVAIVASLPIEQQPTYDNIVSKVEQTRPQMERAIRTETLISYLYIYRSVSQTELDQYITFASSAAGSNYHDAAMSGLKKALIEGGYKLGELIADIIKQSSNVKET